MLKSIKSRFIFFTVLLVLLSIAFPTYFLLEQFQKNFMQRSQAMLQTTLNVVKNALYSEMLSGRKKQLQSLVNQLSINKNIDHIRIIESSGVILYATNMENIGKNILEADPKHKKDYDKKAFSILKSRNVYFSFEPIKNEQRCQNCHDPQKDTIAYLDIDTNLTTAEQYFYTGFRHTFFLAVSMIFVLILGFYYLFKKTIEKPLQNLSGALLEVEQDNFNAFLPARGLEELKPIEEHFNKMVSHLKASRKRIDDLHFEQLQRADKLVTLGELAAEMAHEINNPLGICMSRIDYLRMEVEENPSLMEYTQDLQVVLKQFEKISKITAHVLKYSKKYPKNFRRINLITIIEESVAIIQPQMKKHNIEFEQIYKCEYDCKNAWIDGDGQQIEQVIINLVQNAIDSIESNGKITSEIICLAEDKIEIKITDNGKGMDEEIKQQIFLPFFTTKPADKGTGLGLYIVRKICEKHGGQITCQSKPGHGTSFSIIFQGSKE